MPTINQLIRKPRTPPRYRNKDQALQAGTDQGQAQKIEQAGQVVATEAQAQKRPQLAPCQGRPATPGPPCHCHELYRNIPMSYRLCRVYAETNEYDAVLAGALDTLVGPNEVDDRTNM